MFSQAVANGIKRDDVIDAIKGSIYYGDTKSQMSQYLKSYGFSPDEIQKFVK